MIGAIITAAIVARNAQTVLAVGRISSRRRRRAAAKPREYDPIPDCDDPDAQPANPTQEPKP